MSGEINQSKKYGILWEDECCSYVGGNKLPPYETQFDKNYGGYQIAGHELTASNGLDYVLVAV